MSKPRVYLSGGLKTNWQNKVIEACQNEFIFFNPREHALEANLNAYTAWDLHHLKECDIVFAYMEATNPSGYGLALEVGYAKAMNKTILLIDDRSITDVKFSHYFKIIRACTDIILPNLNEAINVLKSFAQKELIYIPKIIETQTP